MKNHVKGFNHFINENYFFYGEPEGMEGGDDDNYLRGMRGKVHKMLPNSGKRGTVKLRDEFRNAPEEVQREIMQLTRKLGDMGQLNVVRRKISSMGSLEELISAMHDVIDNPIEREKPNWDLRQY